MHTILGANGIIGEGLAKVLHANYSTDIRIVGRNPLKINETDQLIVADLLDAAATYHAVADSEIVYLTVGLPYSSEIFKRDWPIILSNVIAACAKYQCKLVYFDNTYMYDQSQSIQVETSPFAATGIKGIAKAQAANLVLSAISSGQIEGMICRAPEFYGPGKTKGITNALVFSNIKNQKPLNVILRDDTKRTLIYTPDASRAMALLGNTADCYGQTWHLPCDDNRLNYKEFIKVASELYGSKLEHIVLNREQLDAAATQGAFIKETVELFPRYEVDNLFDSSKFKERFPQFEVTTYREGIASILAEM